MSRGARGSLVTVFFLLVGAGLWLQPDPRETTRTSFGRVPEGFGALFDWLLALELPAERSYASPALLPKTATLWWIDPRVDCDGEALEAWIAAGGTAVIAEGSAVDIHDCVPVASLVLPARAIEAAQPTDASPAMVTGPLVAAPRALDCGKLAGFAPSPEWETWARVGERPFILARTVGAGRVVLVADASFLENGCFAKADAAPLAGDLVRRLGTPWLDESTHGLSPQRGTLETLARSHALAFFVGVALLGLLHVWRGAALPPRRLDDSLLPAPTLETFVDSLAALYAGTGDHARVAERYRELTLARLRRLFALPPGTTARQVRERLERRPGISRAGLDALASTQRVTSRRALEQNVAVLDALVRSARG